MYDPREHGKQIIRFGDWVVTTDGIAWGKDADPPYFIDKSRLWEIRPDSNRDKWDWLVQKL